MQKAQHVKYNIIKYNIKENKVTFILCHDFDSADEPLPNYYINFKDGQPITTKGFQIWHHKWMFVDDDYMGFDVEHSKQRSYKWVTTMKDVNYSKIGNPNIWEQLLKKYKINDG